MENKGMKRSQDRDRRRSRQREESDRLTLSTSGPPPHLGGYLVLAILFLLWAVAPSARASTNTDLFAVEDFGAKADGKTDDTAAFQKALDSAGQAGGGVVYVPRGNYFFGGHLNVPNAVALKGVWESVPAHVGIRNPGMPKPTDDGTTFLVTENRGKEDGAP